MFVLYRAIFSISRSSPSQHLAHTGGVNKAAKVHLF